MDRRYMNNREMCICCFRPPAAGGDLAIHHIRYFPELCCYVHDRCHEEIHGTPSKYPYLIQYEEGDNVKFYEMRILSADSGAGRGRGRGRYKRGRRGGGRRRDRRPDEDEPGRRRGGGRDRDRGGRDRDRGGREQHRRRI